MEEKLSNSNEKKFSDWLVANFAIFLQVKHIFLLYIFMPPPYNGFGILCYPVPSCCHFVIIGFVYYLSIYREYTISLRYNELFRRKKNARTISND
jgi:hypothetical protein